MLTSLRIVVSVAVGGLTALAIGIPTGVIETDWYSRMTPVLWWNYPAWVMSSTMTGALAATYVRPRTALPSQSGKTFSGGLLSVFAVGCPICNKLVVIALGVNGALTWFAPLQPVLALLSVALLAYALSARVRTLRACALGTRPSIVAPG